MNAVVYFCGMGGACQGLERAGVRVRLAVDGWDAACIAHRRWMPDTPIVRARCEAAPVNGARPWLLWASPSCKPYSTANRTPKRGKAHPEYYSTALLVRQAVEMGTRWLVMENVGGLLWSKEGKVELAEMREEARRLGLCWNASIVNSNTVGVAQIRRRLFVVVGPEYVKIPHGSDYIPPENAETPPMACEGSKGSWERETRWPKAAAACKATTSPHDPQAKSKWRASKGIVVSEHGLARSPATLAAWRTAQAVVDASPASRHADWTGASVALPSVRSGEHLGSRQREGFPSSAAGRTLADCCALQQVPIEVLAGFSKRVAHELVGNACPPPLIEHVARTLLAVG